MNRFTVFAAALLGFLAPQSAVQAFDLAFDWGNIPLCTTGSPNRVGSPEFTVGGVPAGTAAIRFVLTDRDVTSFNHGGGTVAYSGGSKVAAGAFKYLSPCPPNGSHTYRWDATALDASGKRLDTGRASKKYP